MEGEDRPGALAEFADRLGRAGIMINGLLIVGRRNRTGRLAITTDGNTGARELLTNHETTVPD